MTEQLINVAGYEIEGSIEMTPDEVEGDGAVVKERSRRKPRRQKSAEFF